MNPLHIHLLLNHFPVIGIFLALPLLVFAIWRKSDELKKAALGAFVVLALLSIPVFLSGEPAEEAVENLPGVSEAIIEQHEEAAALALTGILILGVVSLTALFLFRKNKIPGWVPAVSLAIGIVVAGLMAYTGNLGGMIRHTEIRPDAPAWVSEKASEYEHD